MHPDGLFFVLLLQLVAVVAEARQQWFTCYEQTDPRDVSSRYAVDCTPLGRKHLFRTELAVSGFANETTPNSHNSTTVTSLPHLRSPLASILSEAALEPPIIGQNQTNMFVFNVSCLSTTSTATCEEASTAMRDAGQLVSNVLFLTEPVVVNVTVLPFCESARICSDGTDSLAAAAPARTIALQDDDDIFRLYPQALVKQFSDQLQYVPDFSAFDINLNINSEASFYYSGSGAEIMANQTDILYVVLHELFHGLGFTSSYEDYFNSDKASLLTPNILIENVDNSSSLQFSGFIEYAFDRQLHTASGAVTEVVKAMNNVAITDTLAQVFADAEALGRYFESNSVIGPLSRSLASNFTTRHSTTFTTAMQNQTSLITLETSIRPFSSGSSVSHMASDVYEGTTDFLMRFISAKGVTLAQTLQELRRIHPNEVDVYGAIGPGLRVLMASIGYRVRGGSPADMNLAAANTRITTASTSGGTHIFPASRLVNVLCAICLVGSFLHF